MSSTPTTPFRLALDVNGKPTFGILFSVAQQNVTLSPGVEKHFTVPAAVDMVLFSYSAGANVWVSNATTATLPSSSFADNGCQLNPILRNVTPGQTISVISSSADDVNANFYLASTISSGVPQP